jgi:hypothetical protein
VLGAEHFEGMGRNSSGKTIAFCVKCRAKRNVKDGHLSLTKNHKKMMKGKCSVCGTMVCKFV